MREEIKLSWDDVKQKVVIGFGAIFQDRDKNDDRHIPSIWGVPRGGTYIAEILRENNLAIVSLRVHESVEYVVDDLIDSGKTLEEITDGTPHIKFWAPYKTTNDHWYTFPWER